MMNMPDGGGSVDGDIEDEGDGAESDTLPDKYFTANGNRRTFTSGQRHLILNVYSRLRKADFGNVTECIAETTRLTGASKATVSKLKRQFNAAEDAQCTSKPRLTTPGRKRVNRLPPHANLDHFDRAAIRKLIHTQFIRCNQVPAVWKVKAFIDADPNLPNMGKTSLHRLLKDMGIQFKKRRRNAAVIEDDDVRLWRQNYLRQVKAHREAGRKLYWLDETWLSGQSGVISSSEQSSAAKPNMNNNNNINNEEHVDRTMTMMTPPDDQLQGATATTPSRKVLPIGVGKCDRLIVTHVGSDTGFVDGALFVFENRKVGDSQTEMSADVFEEWFAKTLLPRLEPNSVIVLSNAPYHSVKMEKIPEKGCNKAEIQAWLSSKGIAYTDDMIVLELLELINQVKDRYDVYRVDVAARLAGHTVLRLPPHHTFLNPIDMVFDQIKQYVGRESSKVSTLTEVRRLLHEGVARVTAYNWSCCVQYVMKEEEIMRNAPDDGSDSDASGGDMDDGHDDGAAVWSDDSE